MAPVDLVKNRLQVQSSEVEKVYCNSTPPLRTAFPSLHATRTILPTCRPAGPPIHQFADPLPKVYSGPIDVVVKTVKKDGAKAMFDGYTATVIQRMVGLPFLFVFYDLTKQAARRCAILNTSPPPSSRARPPPLLPPRTHTPTYSSAVRSQPPSPAALTLDGSVPQPRQK